jgi:hypothetical protein
MRAERPRHVVRAFCPHPSGCGCLQLKNRSQDHASSLHDHKDHGETSDPHQKMPHKNPLCPPFPLRLCGLQSPLMIATTSAPESARPPAAFGLRACGRNARATWCGHFARIQADAVAFNSKTEVRITPQAFTTTKTMGNQRSPSKNAAQKSSVPSIPSAPLWFAKPAYDCDDLGPAPSAALISLATVWGSLHKSPAHPGGRAR